MQEAVLAALITGAATVIVQLLISHRERTEQEILLRRQVDLLIGRLDILEGKVEKHNNLVERIYKTEADMTSVKERLAGISHIPRA
ncbi:MAG TPA: hypothetical protein PLU75_02625 [Oscillospiraceae bacterium]|jgi:sensor domain CHASE-containing protein|nr:hypothetical protein [Oscillospiraceae bacterium]HQQ89070.1 hypothetical protein [Oscillospiraceae bacterium]HRW56874.1 hypothetical protein [Oscillospiraceae bacterium]